MRRPELTTSAYVFGLHVASELPLRTLESEAGHGCDTVLTTSDDVGRGSLWNGGAEAVLERRSPTGRLVMAIHRSETSGYRVLAPGFGTHVVSPDGTRVVSRVPAISQWRWQRLLFAQVLPLAATLQGLELLHASAVGHDGRALGFIASSGTGKTSLAIHLVARGARFFTDDVLALEIRGSDVVAHPGPATASVAPAELRSLGPGRDALGDVVGRSDKLQLAVRPLERPLRLAALYFLERRSDERPNLTITETPREPALLLGAAFINYLRSPAVLRAHLDACAAIADTVRIFRIRIPSTAAASDVATAVEHHCVDLS